MYKALAVIITVLIAGCHVHSDGEKTTISASPIDTEEKSAYDMCLRAQLFQQCLQSLPAGPNATKYNDWDEVVSECETAAARQSRRIRKHIKPECRNE